MFLSFGPRGLTTLRGPFLFFPYTLPAFFTQPPPCFPCSACYSVSVHSSFFLLLAAMPPGHQSPRGRCYLWGSPLAARGEKGVKEGYVEVFTFLRLLRRTSKESNPVSHTFSPATNADHFRGFTKMVINCPAYAVARHHCFLYDVPKIFPRGVPWKRLDIAAHPILNNPYHLLPCEPVKAGSGANRKRRRHDL